MGGGGWANPLQTLPQGLVLTFDFDFDVDVDPDPDPELDNNSKQTQNVKSHIMYIVSKGLN